MANRQTMAPRRSTARRDVRQPDQRTRGQVVDPFEQLRNEMTSLLEDFWGRGSPLAAGETPAFQGILAPSVDVRDDDQNIYVKAELPGVSQNDVSLELADGVLTISGEKRHEDEQRDEQGTLRYSERAYGSFARQVDVGPDIDEDNVSATFADGVLTVTLPKTQQARERSKRIPIQGQR